MPPSRNLRPLKAKHHLRLGYKPYKRKGPDWSWIDDKDPCARCKTEGLDCVIKPLLRDLTDKSTIRNACYECATRHYSCSKGTRRNPFTGRRQEAAARQSSPLTPLPSEDKRESESASDEHVRTPLALDGMTMGNNGKVEAERLPRLNMTLPGTMLQHPSPPPTVAAPRLFRHHELLPPSSVPFPDDYSDKTESPKRPRRLPRTPPPLHPGPAPARYPLRSPAIYVLPDSPIYVPSDSDTDEAAAAEEQPEPEPPVDVPGPLIEAYVHLGANEALRNPGLCSSLVCMSQKELQARIISDRRVLTAILKTGTVPPGADPTRDRMLFEHYLEWGITAVLSGVAVRDASVHTGLNEEVICHYAAEDYELLVAFLREVCAEQAESG